MRFRHPNRDAIQRFLQQQSRLELTYPEVGQTNGAPSAGYNVDHTRTLLGTGDRVFESACSALKSWRQIQLPWLSAWPACTSIQTGGLIAVLARTMGMWWLNACRIVYTIEDSIDTQRWGFAYGTLPAHAASGEERFMIEMDDADNVWYDILAYSKPNSFEARLAYRIFRNSQRQFGSDSCDAMQRFVDCEHDARLSP